MCTFGMQSRRDPSEGRWQGRPCTSRPIAVRLGEAVAVAAWSPSPAPLLVIRSTFFHLEEPPLSPRRRRANTLPSNSVFSQARSEESAAYMAELCRRFDTALGADRVAHRELEQAETLVEASPKMPNAVCQQMSEACGGDSSAKSADPLSEPDLATRPAQAQPWLGGGSHRNAAPVQEHVGLAQQSASGTNNLQQQSHAVEGRRSTEAREGVIPSIDSMRTPEAPMPFLCIRSTFFHVEEPSCCHLRRRASSAPSHAESSDERSETSAAYMEELCGRFVAAAWGAGRVGRGDAKEAAAEQEANTAGDTNTGSGEEALRQPERGVAREEQPEGAGEPTRSRGCAPHGLEARVPAKRYSPSAPSRGAGEQRQLQPERNRLVDTRMAPLRMQQRSCFLSSAAERTDAEQQGGAVAEPRVGRGSHGVVGFVARQCSEDGQQSKWSLARAQETVFGASTLVELGCRPSSPSLTSRSAFVHLEGSSCLRGAQGKRPAQHLRQRAMTTRPSAVMEESSRAQGAHDDPPASEEAQPSFAVALPGVSSEACASPPPEKQEPKLQRAAKTTGTDPTTAGQPPAPRDVAVAQSPSQRLDDEQLRQEEYHDAFASQHMLSLNAVEQRNLGESSSSSSRSAGSAGSSVQTAMNVGSLGHPDFCARPCIFFASSTCANGLSCGYCHGSHVKRPARLNKARKDMLMELPDAVAKACLMPLVRRKALAIDDAVDTRSLLQALDEAWHVTPEESMSVARPPRLGSVGLRSLLVTLRHTMLRDRPEAMNGAEALLQHLSVIARRRPLA